MGNKTSAYIGLALVLGYWAYAIISISTGAVAGKESQWDFKTYYYAAKVDAMGGDPYSVDALNSVAPEQIALPYVYPPLTIYFFRVFALFDWSTAFQLWLWLKVILAALLVILWRASFYNGGSSALFLLFALLAFTSAIYWDLLTGNVSLVEQILLWLGFLFFIKRRSIPFVILILLASFFKFTYLAFLILLLMLPKRQRVVAGGLGLIGAGGYAAASYLVDPERFASFLTLVRLIKEGGAEYNHSMLAFLTDTSNLIAASTGTTPLPQGVVVALYLLLVVAVVLATTRFWRRYGATGETRDSSSVLIVFMVCIVYAVIAPRMKSYSYILLILPAFYFVREYAKSYALLFAFMLLSLGKWTPLPTVDAVRLLWWHYPWLLALLLWILMLKELKRRRVPAEVSP